MLVLAELEAKLSADRAAALNAARKRTVGVIAKLKTLCRSWGGHLILLSREQFILLDKKGADDYSPSPFEAYSGLNWTKKVVYVDRLAATCGPTIHEMGHVFASPTHPEAVDTHEFDFFGWEVCVANLVGAYQDWTASNGEYSVTNTDIGQRQENWQDLSQEAQTKLVAERTQWGIHKKLITPDYCPLAVR
jgi:hypothetical protein